MKTIFHPANERGHANHGWLNAYHSFSFSSYNDPSKVHFGALRVLNDDTIAGGMGFGMHPHDNMEIVTIPLEGAIQHSDNMGHTAVISAGEVQHMSAGTGVMHAEKNANHNNELKLLQIWVIPKKLSVTPSYDQRKFAVEARKNAFQTLVSPEGGDSIKINQESWFSMASLEKGRSLTYNLHGEGQGVYVFLIDGNVDIEDINLNKRDAAGIWDTDSIEITAHENAEILLIEVPMTF